ncbi:MAG: hypothetical protein DDT36_01498 [Firmicutes bacterium]|nr:hypothetical protein [Bacillota bacterium]
MMADEPELPFYLWSDMAALLDDDHRKLYAIAKKYYMETDNTKLATTSYQPMVCTWFAKAYAKKVEANGI